MLEKCTICPHKCGIDRTKNIGRCKSTDKIKIALYSTHRTMYFWQESVLERFSFLIVI